MLVRKESIKGIENILWDKENCAELQCMAANVGNFPHRWRWNNEGAEILFLRRMLRNAMERTCVKWGRFKEIRNYKGHFGLYNDERNLVIRFCHLILMARVAGRNQVWVKDSQRLKGMVISQKVVRTIKDKEF